MTVRVSDCAFLLAILNDGREHALTEIIETSQRERGCGMTVHSRAADLRRRGYTIRQRSEIGPSGRRLSFYRLVTDRGGHGAQGDPATGSASLDETAAAASPSSLASPESAEAERLGPDGIAGSGVANEPGPLGESGHTDDEGPLAGSSVAAEANDASTIARPDSPGGQLVLLPASGPGAYEQDAA